MNSSLESMPLEAIVEKVGREPEDDAQVLRMKYSQFYVVKRFLTSCFSFSPEMLSGVAITITVIIPLWYGYI